jgi:hypothetical protein
MRSTNKSRTRHCRPEQNRICWTAKRLRREFSMPELRETGKVEDIRHPLPDSAPSSSSFIHSHFRNSGWNEEAQTRSHIPWATLDGIWSYSGLGSISFSPLQMKQNSQTNTKTGCPDSLPWPTNNTSVTQTKDTHFHLRRKNDEKPSTEFKQRK